MERVDGGESVLDLLVAGQNFLTWRRGRSGLRPAHREAAALAPGGDHEGSLASVQQVLHGNEDILVAAQGLHIGAVEGKNERDSTWIAEYPEVTMTVAWASMKLSWPCLPFSRSMSSTIGMLSSTAHLMA